MKKFKEYLEKLQTLNTDKTLLNKNKLVLLLSGSSDYSTASLSDEQLEFLSVFKEFSYEIVNSNFPYNEDFNHSEFKDISMIKAGLSNIIYYYHTCYSKKFKAEVIRHTKNLFNLDDIIIVTQSSGLNILAEALKYCPVGEKKMKILALGPVSQKVSFPQSVDCVIVKGKSDIYSKLLDNNQAHKIVDCGHFDYLKNKEVREFVYEWLQKNKN